MKISKSLNKLPIKLKVSFFVAFLRRKVENKKANSIQI